MSENRALNKSEVTFILSFWQEVGVNEFFRIWHGECDFQVVVCEDPILSYLHSLCVLKGDE